MSVRPYRRLLVRSVVVESESAKSFHLVAEDGMPLAPYSPGQHLPIRLNMPGVARPVYRCYTISNFGEKHYRLTVKKEVAPSTEPEVDPGRSSSFFHDLIVPGSEIEAKPPAGNFWLDLKANHPIVLIAGGIGVTPMMSMLEALALGRSHREVHFYFCLRHAGDHVFKHQLQEIQSHLPGLRMHVCYEYPSASDRKGHDYHAVGRIEGEALRSSASRQETEFFLCGPPGMMQSVSSQILDLGIAPDRIRTESFGPSSIALRELISADDDALNALQQASGTTVTFARSSITVPWAGEFQNLLQLADANGVEISFGCQYGDCGTCMTRLLEGKVKYLHPTGARPDPGHCLPCSCRPDGNVVLDV